MTMARTGKQPARFLLAQGVSPPAGEMTVVWNEWKTKRRLSTHSTRPWESRTQREIPTFPQLRRRSTQGAGRRQNGRPIVGGGKVEIHNQDSHFSTTPTACGARKKHLIANRRHESAKLKSVK